MQSLAPDSPDSTDAEEERTSKTSTAQPTDEQATHAPDKDRNATHGAKSDTKADAERPKAQGQQAAGNTEFGQAREVGAGSSTTEWSSMPGGSDPHQRLLLIALDGATPELVLGAWRNSLRTIARLAERGSYGRLQGIAPCASLPAWCSLFTSLDPGQLGIYASAQRPNHSYAPPAPLTAQSVHAPRLWEILSRAGRSVGVLSAPLTTPAKLLNGHLLGDQSSVHNVIAYPPAFAQQVAQWLADEPPISPAQGSLLEQQIAEIYTHTEQRFRLARRMLARTSYNCFVLFDNGLAQIERLLWHTLDITHLRHQPTHPLAGVISAFYRFIDDQVSDLLELLDDTTTVALVSACGAQPLDGEFALNDWLIAEGELRLRQQPTQPTSLTQSDIDWAATRAWASENGMLYLNLAGREPSGCITADEAEPFLQHLTERIQALQPPAVSTADTPTFTAYRPSALYASVHNVAPDLFVVGARPGWRTNALVGHPDLWHTVHTAALDAAYESPRGLFVLYDPQHPGGGREIRNATLYDVMPTLLALFGITPPRTRGKALV